MSFTNYFTDYVSMVEYFDCLNVAILQRGPKKFRMVIFLSYLMYEQENVKAVL